MYSVEDLLISHGYKLPQNNNSVPSSHQSTSLSSSYEQRQQRSKSRSEIGDKRSGHIISNGYKADSTAYVSGSSANTTKGYPCDTESRDRKQRTEGEGISNQGDRRSPGDSLTSDSGLYDGPRGMSSQPRGERDVAYWRRRGQDFSVLLDYAEFREHHGGGGGVRVPGKAEGMRRTPEMATATEEQYRERQCRADMARARERELALQQWKMSAERKYQSLGTEEWRPAMGVGRQPSEGEGDKWTQEQRRPRTAEGAVPPRTKAKSQSLPRMALPSDGLQYFSMSSSTPDPYGSYRINGHPTRDPHGRHHSEGSGRERWAENGRSGAQSAPLPKARFSRPLRPPSYEAHQQMRGSVEMLSADMTPRSRDRTPLPFTRQEYFAPDPGGSGMEPPGYIPPPSYRRQPIRVNSRSYADAMGNYQYRGDPYLQGPAMAEVQQWFMRQTGMSWPDHHRDGRRSVPCRRQAYPGYNEERLGNVQYIPFDDPRVRHISGGGIDGNSLTDADKIRNIRNEMPVIPLSEKNPDDSAFFPPEVSFNSTEPSKSNLSNCVNEDSWQRQMQGKTNSNTAVDQNCNLYPAIQENSKSPQVSQPSFKQEQGFSEMITQVKKFEPEETENKKSRRKLKETMFCLVSVPINLQTTKEAADQNNNEKEPSPTVRPVENTASQSHHQSVSNTSSSMKELQTHSTSSSSMKSPQNAPLRKEFVDAWSLQESADKELCYAGSWPGNQYRNQETQTGSPEVSRGASSSSTLIHGMLDPPSSDTTTDSGVSTDCSANYGFPIKGQKNLSPSCNSAFSRTRAGSSSSQPGKAPAQHQPSSTPRSPDLQPSNRGSAPKPQVVEEAFGQFLLKPVGRRPWDAIEELESINKELQDQIGKRPSANQSIENLDEAYQNIVEMNSSNSEVGGTAHGMNPNSLEWETKRPISSPDNNLSEQHLIKSNLNIRSDSDSKSIVVTQPDNREVRRAFSRPKGKSPNLNKPQKEEDIGLVRYEVPEMLRGDPGSLRQDIAVPKECLLKDVGLTVYTTIPDTVDTGSPAGLSPESPMLTSPSDHSELCESLPITPSEGRRHLDKHSLEINTANEQSSVKSVSLNNQTHFHSKMENERHNKKDISVSNSSERLPHSLPAKSYYFKFRTDCIHNDNDDETYSDHLRWENEQTLADKHLETLLSQEKANSMATEDLSNLYQVQCAEGIPENESIEQRAARILGIAVPAESLVVAQQDGNKLSQGTPNSTESELVFNEATENETRHVRRKSEDVSGTTMDTHGEAQNMEEEIGSGKNFESSVAESSVEVHTVIPVFEIPEFPPGSLPLSLPATEDMELALSVSGRERKGWSTGKIVEALQDKLAASSSSPSLGSQTGPERIARMKEVDSVFHMKHLSLKSTNSTEETEEEIVEDETEEEGKEEVEMEKEMREGLEDEKKGEEEE
ncbi:junctional protein associated with coronary artery disease homolog, partial [Chanos chanos]|uniref:Junctional protein associated with coronary artery disease homolog n=1 Tax=Chanos chanos TaxID=29144 RepID=A0A6J2VG80_CHACN